MHASKFEHMIGSTSLPPKIEGQVRRYIKVEIPFLSWVPPTPAQDALVKVLWWGEEGGGTVFRPGRSRKQRKDASEMTCALYQVRSGPKQFLEYLKDMKVLCLQVIQATNNNAIGQAFIQRLHQLSPGKPIKGLYPVITSSNTKVADIQINISMEPLNS
ncbi:hypothetical protein HELRODRAFT_158307 [Helobdella robusta]|uniref:C2CD3 N-terminal C2 domain-containing protein n=1 Tax=Helobdella robusta TaxID=6412 RepID=T1EMM5_HELRO|nr:hypothetical protein HELRODRAFT_158307 [Helobdella robusta]ESO11944.1 hypothetical protein HELRODRAFT_158307 [Helobdella robusta]